MKKIHKSNIIFALIGLLIGGIALYFKRYRISALFFSMSAIVSIAGYFDLSLDTIFLATLFPTQALTSFVLMTRGGKKPFSKTKI